MQSINFYLAPEPILIYGDLKGVFNFIKIMINYTWEEYNNDVIVLTDKIKASKIKYNTIYGILRGGLILAKDLAQKLELAFITNIDNIDSHTLVVDDICDSGRTLEKFRNYDTAVLFAKNDIPTYSINEADNWIIFPWEESKDKDAEDIVVRMLQHIGEDPNREGLKGTPERVVRMWKEIYRGYDDRQIPRMAVFENGQDGVRVDEMVIDTGYYFSQCEHHLVPFFGQYYFAYVPNKKIIGLSKVARIVDHFSAKAQIQERLVAEILNHIEKELEPLGCALVMKGRHLCKESRGVKKVNGMMVTSDLRGIFKEWETTRQEFLSFVNSK